MNSMLLLRYMKITWHVSPWVKTRFAGNPLDTLTLVDILLVKAGIVKLIPLRTHKMVADALTKSLPSPAFIAHRKVMLGHVPFALKFLGSCRDYISDAAVRGFKFVRTHHFSLLLLKYFFLGYSILQCTLSIEESDTVPRSLQPSSLQPSTWFS